MPIQVQFDETPEVEAESKDEAGPEPRLQWYADVKQDVMKRIRADYDGQTQLISQCVGRRYAELGDATITVLKIFPDYNEETGLANLEESIVEVRIEKPGEKPYEESLVVSNEWNEDTKVTRSTSKNFKAYRQLGVDIGQAKNNYLMRFENYQDAIMGSLRQAEGEGLDHNVSLSFLGIMEAYESPAGAPNEAGANARFGQMLTALYLANVDHDIKSLQEKVAEFLNEPGFEVWRGKAMKSLVGMYEAREDFGDHAGARDISMQMMALDKGAALDALQAYEGHASHLEEGKDDDVEHDGGEPRFGGR